MHDPALCEVTTLGWGSIASPLNLPLPSSVTWTIYLGAVVASSLAIWIAGRLAGAVPELEPPGELEEAA